MGHANPAPVSERERAISKVRKLLALAAHPATPLTEARLAEDRVGRLQALHGITFEEVRATPKVNPASVFEELIRRANAYEQFRREEEAAKRAEAVRLQREAQERQRKEREAVRQNGRRARRSGKPPTIYAQRVVGASRPGSKKRLVAELISRPGGATIEEIVAATGWQRHTVRAAVSRARKGAGETSPSA